MQKHDRTKPKFRPVAKQTNHYIEKEYLVSDFIAASSDDRYRRSLHNHIHRRICLIYDL